jgi:hypothetical protein
LIGHGGGKRDVPVCRLGGGWLEFMAQGLWIEVSDPDLIITGPQFRLRVKGLGFRI